MRKFVVTLLLLLPLFCNVLNGHCADCQAMEASIIKERNFMKKQKMVETAYASCPDSSVVLFLFGFNKERFGQPKEALKYYKEATRLDPKMAKAWFGVGDVYAELGNVDLAIKAYDQGLVFDPTNVRAIRSKTELQQL